MRLICCSQSHAVSSANTYSLLCVGDVMVWNGQRATFFRQTSGYYGGYAGYTDVYF